MEVDSKLDVLSLLRCYGRVDYRRFQLFINYILFFVVSGTWYGVEWRQEDSLDYGVNNCCTFRFTDDTLG